MRNLQTKGNSWILVLILTLPFTAVSVQAQSDETTGGGVGKLQPISQLQRFEDAKRSPDQTAQAEKTRKVKRKHPTYRPPRVGAPAPGRRVGGGTRGTRLALPVVVVLAPDHTGQTMNAEPTLYWFVSQAGTKTPVFFTLTTEDGIKPLVETQIARRAEPGIQVIRLADYDVRLEVGMSYVWSIALVPDPDHRSKDVVAMGAIRLVEPPATVSAQLAERGNADAPWIYAEAGLWYDALEAISDLIEGRPSDEGLREQRAALLEQVKLPVVTWTGETTAMHAG